MRLLCLAFFIVFSSVACDSSVNTASTEPLQLTPLAPYLYEFSNEQGKNRIDYFFINQENNNDAQFRDALYQLVVSKKPQNINEYALYSIYMYRKTEQLNERFTAKADFLRATYFDDVISYSRWNKGHLDMFYLIKNGDVMFDMIDNTAVSPSWKFE